jgi:hypothetical protein
MAIDVEAALRTAVAHPRFGALTVEALKRLSEGNWTSGHGEQPIPVSQFASVWRLRLNMGRYDARHVLGVPETVASMEARSGAVRLATREAGDRGLVSVWVDDHDELVGLILVGGNT